MYEPAKTGSYSVYTGESSLTAPIVLHFCVKGDTILLLLRLHLKKIMRPGDPRRQRRRSCQHSLVSLGSSKYQWKDLANDDSHLTAVFVSAVGTGPDLVLR